MIGERALSRAKECDDEELERATAGLLSMACTQLGDHARALQYREQVHCSLPLRSLSFRSLYLLGRAAPMTRGGDCGSQPLHEHGSRYGTVTEAL
jgi:hypothetical protein